MSAPYPSTALKRRQGSSGTIGVIVPHINQKFFSDAIAGIEEACSENNHSLIICQSQESYRQECLAIETLIHQHVDCILISVSAETESSEYLDQIMDRNINLIQFDRCLDVVKSYKVINNNKEASYIAVKNLIVEGYRRIAFIGGPGHLSVFRDRKEGYLQAITESRLGVPLNLIIDNAFSKESAMKAARELIALREPPDAILTVADHQSLGVLEVARSLGLEVPHQLGIFGFANEVFTEMIQPALSSVDQKNKALGRSAANLYFKNILTNNLADGEKNKVIKSSIIIRQSSLRSNYRH